MFWVRSLLVIVSVLLLIGGSGIFQYSLTASFTMSHDPSCIHTTSTSDSSALRCVTSPGNCHPWIQASVMEPVLFTGVRLAADGLNKDLDALKAFKISYSHDALTWKYLKPKTLKKEIKKDTRGKSAAAAAAPMFTIPCHFTAKHLQVDLLAESKSNRTCLHFSLVEQNAVSVMPESGGETYIFTALYQPSSINTINTRKPHTRASTHHLSIGRTLLQISELSLVLSCTSGCGGDSSEPVTLTVTCSNCDGLGSVSYTWDIQIVQLEDLPREVWEDRAGFSSDNTALTLPGRFFNPFESYVVSVSGTSSVTEGTANYTIPAKEHTLYITSSINTTSASVDSRVTFLVLLNSSDPDIVVSIGEYDSCTPDFATVSNTTRRTYPLSMFLLSNYTKGLKYAVFDTQFHTDGNFIISATTTAFPSSSSEVSVSVVYEKMEVGMCTNNTEMINASTSIQNAEIWGLSDDLYFKTIGGDACPSLTESYSWSLQRYTAGSVSKCTSEKDFEALLLNTTHNQVLFIPSGHLSDGHYKLCLALDKHNNSVLLGTRTVCGFIELAEDDDYGEEYISCTHECPGGCTESVSLTASCPHCQGSYSWNIHKIGYGLLPQQVWENRAMFFSNNSTLTLPADFFNPFENYRIIVSGSTSWFTMEAVCFISSNDNKVYITSNSNTTSVPVDSYITFLLLVNDSSSSVSVDIGGQDSCIPSLQTLTPAVRSSYPLSTFLLSSSTEGLTYALFGTHLGRAGNFIINASTASPTPSQSLTSLDVVYEKIDVGQCTNDIFVNGASRSIQAAPVYFRSSDLYLILYGTESCVLTFQNYHWTVVSYKEEDTSMCYREEDFESVTLPAGIGNSEILYIPAGALPQGYYRVGVSYENHDSHSSVGSRTLYGFLQFVNEPLVVVMSPSVTHLAHDRNLPLVLNASASYNPNVGLPTTIRYSWHCQMDGQPCDCVPKMWPAVGNDTQIIPLTESVLGMNGRYLTAGQNYSFTVALDSDDVTGSNHTVLVAVSGVVSMQLEINCTSGCGDDSTEPVTLTVTCTDCDGLGSVSYTWDIHKGQVGVLPPQMWEGHAVLNSDKTTLTLPGHFFNPFELYNISVTALTNASSEGSAFHMMPVREDKVYITSNSNTTSVPVDSYITFLLLVNDSSSSVSVDIGGQDSCIPSLQTLTPAVRSSYPLSTFLLSSSTEGLTYALFGTHLGRAGNFIINASTASPTPSQSLTSLDVVYEKIDVGQCTNDIFVNGASRSIQAAPVYFRSSDLYLILYGTESCVLTFQNYHWTVVSYKEEDTSMCYREEDFESVTLPAGIGNSEILYIPAGALPQGYYRVGVSYENHDSHSSVGSRTLYGFLQFVNEPLVVVMSPSVTHLAHDRNLPLVLNASASYNPNVGLPTTIRYSWHCQMDGQPCDCVPKMWPAVGNDTQIIPLTESVLGMNGRYLTAGQNYSFTVALDSDDVTGSNHTVLVAVSGVVSMQLEINCTSGCGDDSTEPVTLTVTCTDCDGLGSVSYTWDIHKGQVGVLPPQMWEGHAVLNSDKTTLTLPGHFFNPFELYNISVTALTNASSEGSAFHMMPVREDKVYITSNSNTTSVPVDSYITFLLLVNDSSSSVSVDIGGQDSCIPSLQTLTPAVRSSYPLSTFLLSSSTEGLTYALFGTHLGRAGNFIINASTASPTPSQSLTSLDVVYEKIDVGQCTNDIFVNGASRSIQAAPVYFRSSDLYLILYGTESCVLTFQNYHWTVVSYKEEDTSMCYREEDFESVTLPAGIGNSEILYIPAGALPQGYYRVGVSYENHDSHSSVGSRTLYGFLQFVNEPLVVVMSPSVTHLAHDRNLPLVLNASASYNPNVGLPTTIRYSWHCQMDGQPCDCVPKMWPAVGNDTQIIPLTESVLGMNGRYLTAGQNYSFTVALDSDDVTGSNHTVLVAVSGVVSMQLEINCTSGCGDDSTEPVTLTVTCTDCDGLGSVSYTWDIHKGQVGVLPPQMWEGHAVLNSDKTTLTLPGHFFNPFELYNISVTALTNASSEGSAFHMMPVREDKVYITSNSNTTSVPVDSYITFLLLVNDSSSSVSVDIGGQDSCIPSLQTLTPAVRSSYPLSTFLLSSSTEGLTYALFGTHLGRAGNFIINASTASPTPSQSLTSLDVVYEKIDVGQCTNDIFVNGASRSIQAAPVYFRSSDLYLILYGTESCVLTFQNYHWTVVSYKEEDTSMCYREEDFESVTLPAGIGNSEILYIPAGALPQGYYRVGVSYENHDSHSSVGSRTLYGFLQFVNEPLVVVMSPSVTHLAHDRNLPLVLNASASYNPNVGLPTTIRYSWHCQMDGQPCDCVPKMWPAVGNDTQIIPLTESVLGMNGRYLTAGQNYSFTVALDSDDVTGSNHTVLVAVSGVVSMQLEINCTSGCGDDSTEPVTLTVTCTDCDGLGSVSYTWDIHKGQVGVLPPQMWEGHAVLNSDKTTLTLPGHFFNPFELYNISVTALTNASSEGSAFHMMPVREDKVYITSNSNTTSVPVDSYITFLLLVNDSSSSVSVDIGGQDSCIPSLQTLTPAVRSSYPLSTFLLSSSTEGLTYALFGTHLGRAGNFIINASTASPTPSQSLTSLDVVYEKIDVGQCTNDIFVNGASRSIQAAPVYFRSSDLYLILYGTESCVLTFQNYHWTVVSYKEEDTSMCYREEDFESVTLPAGIGNSEILYIPAGALPQGYYRVGVSYENHDSHSSVGSRTLYGFLQFVNEPLVVVMSPSVTHLAHDRNLPLVLNASASYNPNVGLPTTIRYSWHCQMDGQPCDCVPKMWPAVGNDTQIIPLTESVLGMNGRYLTAGQNYSFTVALDSDDVTGSNHTVLVAVSGVVSMQLEINCTSGCGDDSTEPVTLTVTCTDCDGLGSVSYTWDIHKGQVGVLPPQMWEGHAVLNSDKTTLTLPGHFFNPFELYNISVTALTNASSEGSAFHMMPVREDKVYITSNSNTTSVPVDSYITFLLLVNDSSSSVSVDIGGQDSCIPSLQTLTPAVRSSYPLSTFLLSSSTEGLTYALFGTHLGRAGNFIINASTASPTPSQSLTSLDVVYEKIDVGQCTNDIFVNGASRSIQAAPVYFRSSDLYLILYGTESCVLTFQNYHWTVVSYKEEDTSMCYREEDFESVTLPAGIGNSEILYIPAGALPQGYYRVGVSYENHDSHSSVGSRTLYGFLQFVNEPLVVVMSPSVTHLAHDRNLPLVLNASASYNPNVGLPTTIRYSWHCQMDGQPCDCVPKMWPAVGNDTQIIPLTESVLGMNGRYLTAGQNYSFTVALDSDDVTGSNHTVLVAVSGVVSMQLEINCTSGCGDDSTEPVTLTVTCTDCDGLGSVSYTWDIHKGQVGVLPPQMWEGHAVLNSDKTTLTLPGHFFNPFELYNISVTALTNASSEGSAFHMMPVREDKVYITSNSNTTSVPVDSYITFLLLVNDSSSSVSVDIGGQDSCIPSLQTLTPAVRSSYPLSTFLLSSSTEGLTYALFGTHLGRAGNFIINASTASPTPSQSLTSLDVVYEKIDVGQCTNDIFVNGASRSIQAAPVYFRSSDLYLILYGTESCVLTFQNYHWTVVSYKEEDTSMCYREEDFESVTLPAGIGNSEILYIPAGALPQGYYRVGVSYENHDSHSSVGSRTLYGFLQFVNEPLVVVMSPSVTHLAHDRNLPLVLNASASYNPNVGLPTTIRYSWHCQMDGQPCDCVPKMWPAVGNDTQIIPLTESVLGMNGRYLTAGQNYSFTVALDSDYVTGSNHTVLVAVSGVVSMQLEINCTSGCGDDSTEPVTLTVTCTDCDGLGSVSYTWDIHKGQVGVLPPQMWEGHAVLNSDKTTLTLPGHFFNPFELYNISVTALTNASSEGSAFHMMPVREDKVYITSNSNTTSVPVDSYITFLLLVNDSSSSVSVDIGGQDSCIPSLQTLTPAVRSSYPLSTFLLSSSTEGLTYALFGTHLGRAGNFIINASTASPTPSQSLTSLDVVYEKIDVGQCTNDIFVNGASRSIQAAPVYFRSSDLYLSLYGTESCVLTFQNYHWTVVSYKEEDTSMCYREEDFESVTLAAGIGNSEILYIPAGALPQGYYRVGVSYENHDSHSSVGSRTLYGFLQFVNEPLVVVMSPSVTHLAHDRNLPLVLNASASYNPNVGLPTTIRYSWHCQMDGQPCDCVPKMWPAVGNDTQIIPLTESVLGMNGRYLTAGQNYSFTVALDSDDVTGSNHTVLVAVSGVVSMQLEINCTSGCGDDSTEPVTLTVTCTDCDGLGSVSYTWDIHKGQVGVLPPQMWEGHAVLNSDKTTLTLPGHFFNPFELYNISVTALTNASSEGSAFHMMPVREDKVYITSNSNTTSVPVDSYITFLLLVNDSSSSVSVDIGGQDSCIPSLQTLTPAVRSSYPLSTFLLSSSTEGLTYALFGTHLGRAGNFIINASTASPTPSQSLTSLDVVYEKIDVGQCTNDIFVNGASRSIQAAPVYFRSSDLYLSLYGTESCVLTFQNYHWTVVSYKEEDTSMCYREEDFESVTLAAGIGNSEILYIPAGALPQGYYRVGVSYENHDSHSSVGSRTLYGFLQFVNEPLVVVMSPSVTHLAHDRNLPLVLNASASYNPNVGLPTTIRYSWHCQMDGQPCDCVPKMWPAVGNDTQIIPLTESVLGMNGRYLTAGQNYSFTVALDSDDVTGSNHTVLVAVSGVVSMQLEINCTSGCGDDSTEPVTLTVTCTDCDGLGSVSYTWDIHKGQVGVLPPQMWEGHAVLNSDKTTLTLPGHFFNPFELYNISVTALTNASSEGSAFHMMPVREDKVYITSNSNTTSVPVDSYITFLLLVNDSSSSVSVDIGGQDSCIPSLQTLTPAVRSSYPLSTFLLSSSTEGLTYALFGTHLGRAGNFIINASTASPTPSQSLTSLDVVYEKIDVGQCTNDIFVNGASRSIQAAPVYFRSSDLYLSLYGTESCVLTFQNYHWTVVSYKEEDTSMCYREEDFESVTLAAGIGNSEILYIPAGALPQGYYRVGVSYENHDSHSSVGSRTLYGFLQFVNEPLVVVMSPSVTHLAHDRNLPLVLNASASYNPNVGLPTTIRYSWHCQMDGQPCDCVPKMWPAVGNDTQIIPLTESVLGMNGRYLTAGQNYSFTVALDSDDVTGSNHTVLVAVSGVVSMQLEINCTSGCGDDSTEPVTLTVTCTDCDGLGSVSYTWDIHKGQVGVLPPQMWEGHAVLNSDKTTLTLPGHFFNPFELYNISVTALTNASSEGSAFHMMPVREDKVYITSNSNTTSVPVDSYITFLLLVNDSSSSVSVDIGGQDSCIPSLQTLTPAVRSSYPLSTFLLSSSTEGLTYALFGTHLGRAGNFIINASTASPTPSQSLTSLDVVYEKIDVGQCTNDIFVNGASRSIQAAPVYFRSSDLYLSLYGTESCVLTFQNYHWTVVSYKEEDTSMCYREEDFESVTLAAGIGNSEILYIPAGALPQGYYRVGVSYENHDSHSSVGSRTLYGFLQVVNEPLVVVMSPSVTHLAHDRNLPLVLNASASYNPNVGLPTTIRYSWHCQMDGQPCDCVPKMWPAVGNDTQIIPFTEPVLTIEGRHLTAGQNYSFTVTLDSDNVTGSNHTVLVVVSGVVSLHFNISCVSGCGGTYEHTDALSFEVSCLDCFGTVTYSWRVERNGLEGLPVSSWAPNAVVGSDGSLTVPPGTLIPWQSYNFIVREFYVFLMPQIVSVSTGSPLLFLILRNLYSSEAEIHLRFLDKYLCTSNLSVITPARRATYPLSFFNLTEQTDSQEYQVVSQQFTVPGIYSIWGNTYVNGKFFSSIVTVTVQNANNCSMNVEILGVGDSLLAATEYTLGHDIHFTSTYSSVCEDLTILSYNWTVSQDLIGDPHRCRFEDDFQEVTLPLTSAVVSSESFHIGKKMLPLGYNRLCLVIVFRTGSVEYQSRACGYLKMLPGPLVTSLSPSASFLTLPRNRPLVLNASTSYNPNSDDQSNISFAWSCVQNGGLCDFFNTMWPGQSAVSILPVSGAVLTIPSDLLTLEQTYRLSIRLSKSGLEGSAANISVLITNPTTPSLLVRCKLGCGVKLNPSELLALEAVCVNCDESGLSIQTYEWSVTRSSTNLPIDAAELAVGTTTGIRQSVFVLSANFFEVSNVYDIRVKATNSKSEEGSTVYTVITNSPPVPGSCSISPLSGQAIITQFTATCTNFVDEDSPLLYRMYLQNEAGQNDMLLYYGQESSTSHLTLPAGLESRNYTRNVSILVFDSYDTSTSVTVSVQVLNLQTGTESVSGVLRDMVQNLSVTTNSQAGDQDILRLAENIATSLNDEVGDAAEESKVKRSETREILLTKLSDVEIQSQDSLEQMTNIIGELTTTTVEVTDTMQVIAVNVSARLTESLGDVAETAPTVAKSIAMKQLLILENLIELTVNPVAETTPAPGSGTSIPPTTKTKMEEKTKPILDVYEKIGDAMLRGIQFSSEEPLHIESKKTSLALAWTKADDDSDMELTAKLQDNGQAGQIRIPIKTSLLKNPTISTDVEAVNVQVQVMSSNPFVWDDSSESINFPIVNIIMKSRGLDGRKLKLEHLLRPADIIITDNTTVSVHAWENHELNVTVDSNSTIISSDSKAIKIASNSSLLVKLNSVNTSLTLKVFVQINRVPSTSEVVDFGFDMPLSPNMLLRSGNLTQAPDQVVLPKIEGSDSTYTVGFTIKPGQSLDTEGLQNGTLVNVSVQTYSLTCSYWDEGLEMWSTRGCLVSPFTTQESLHCLCGHLSVFSGGIFVAPNTVNPITDIGLFLQFFDNPVVVSAVIALWGVYLLVLSWARQKDKEDAKKVGTTVLADNDPSDKYVYLICVVTSWWPQAGTTANIFLYLRARYRQSARHILADPQRKLFTPGAENWFVLTTSRRLGKLKSVVVWHDNKGKNPSWYLKEVVVLDIQTKEVWHCVYDDWLAVDKGPGFIQVEIPSLSQTNMDDHRLYQLMLRSSQDFRNSHLWISIFSKPAYNQFTRAQRLTCGLCLLLTTMLTNIMFHGVPTDAPEDQVQSGTVALSLSGIVIGIQSGLIMFPINTIFPELFTRTAPKEVPSSESLPGEGNRDATSKTGKDEVCEEDIEISICITKTESGTRKAKCKDLKCCVSRNSSEVVSDSEATGSNADKPSVKAKRRYKVDFVKADTCGGDSVTVGTDEMDLAMSRARRKSSTTQTDDAKKKVKKSFRFPWWFLYITWTLCLATCIICSFFVMLYGLKYGYQKSVEWLVSFLTAFTQSATVTQPIKVVVLAVLLTQILKRPVNYDSWTPTEEEEVEMLREKVTQVKSQVTDHQHYYVPPLSTQVLQEICKRIQLDNKARMILYEIVLYFTFVAIFLLMIYGHRDINLAYRVTHTTEIMFTEGTGFSEVSTVDSMWKYLQGNFLDNLVSGTDASSPTSCQASYLVGKARLRQLRLNPGTCSYPAIMKRFSSVSCTGPYWLSDEDTGHYNTSWSQAVSTPATTTMYTYQSSFQLVTIPFVGLHATYSGGGYVQELPRLPDSARGVMDNIQSSDWIDQYTRALFVEFSLYNPNVNLLSVVILVFEFTNLGGVFPYYQIFTSKLYHYRGEFEQFVAACEAIFLIYVIIFTYLEIKKYRQMSTSEYFEDTWSYVEIIILALSYTVFGLFIQRIVTVDYSIKLYKESMGQSFVSFYPAASSDIILQYVMAALSVFIILKVFKLLRFNLRMSILAGSLKRCKGILFQFFIKIFLYTMAFACFSLLVFATELQEYSSFGQSLITLFNFALGASDYFGLESASRTLGPAFFFMFSFLFQFLLISIFISIVMDGYASMVEHVRSLHTEVHMLEFIRRKIKLYTMTNKKKKNIYQRDLYKIKTRR